MVYFIDDIVAADDNDVSGIAQNEFNGATFYPFAEDLPMVLECFAKTIDSQKDEVREERQHDSNEKENDECPNDSTKNGSNPAHVLCKHAIET